MYIGLMKEFKNIRMYVRILVYKYLIINISENVYMYVY